MLNVYETGADHTADHKDQRFSPGHGKWESKESVFIIRLGATRPLLILTEGGQEVLRLELQSGDLYELSGTVNNSTRHSVPKVDSDCGLCVTLSFRLVRNRMSPDGSFAIIDGTRKSLDELQCELLKRKVADLREMCEKKGLDATGSKDDLAERLAAQPGAKRVRELEGAGRVGPAEAESDARVAPPLASAGANAASPAVARGAMPRKTAPTGDSALVGDGSAHDVPSPSVAGKVLLLQGPEMLDHMREGGKLVDNQKMTLETPRWVPIKIGNNKKWRSLSWASEGPLAPLVKALPHKPELASWHGCVPALLYFSECRQASQCNGYPWASDAEGNKCYVVAAAALLKQPVPIVPRGQALSWELSPEERERISAQLPESIVKHDLAVLNAVPRSAGGAEAAGTPALTAPAQNRGEYLTHGSIKAMKASRTQQNRFKWVVVEGKYFRARNTPGDGPKFVPEEGERWLDLGANMGYFALAVLDKGASYVKCVEAEESNAAAIRQNLALNATGSRAAVLHALVRGRPAEGPGILQLSEKSTRNAAPDFYVCKGTERQQEVPCVVTLAALLSEHAYDAVKINIEGAEREVLFNTGAAAWGTVKKMVVEYSFDDFPKRTLMDASFLPRDSV